MSRFSKVALVSTAGEVQKLQHLDFSFEGRLRPKSFACKFRGAGNHETSPSKTFPSSGSGRCRAPGRVAHCGGADLSNASNYHGSTLSGRRGAIDALGRILAEPMTAALRAELASGSRDAPAPSPSAVDPVRARETGQRLRALLSDSDPCAGDFVDANRDQLRALFDAAEWVAFEALVQRYAVADAQAQLENALEISAGRQ